MFWWTRKKRQQQKLMEQELLLQQLLEFPVDYPLCPLPEYQSVLADKVKAFKIGNIEKDTMSYNTILSGQLNNGKYAATQASPFYMSRHDPVVGDYYILYPNGTSFSLPGQVFEEKYKLINNG